MVRRLAVILLPLLLTLATGVYAGNRFERFTIDQGLSQNSVTSMLQDSQGFLWFGTYNGLNRYDGYEFRHFYHQSDNPNSLSSSFVFSLLQDQQGYIWIGTLGGGLNRFDPATEQFERFRHDKNDPTSFAGSQVSALRQTSDGDVLIGTFDNGISVYHPQSNEFEQFVHDPKKPDSIRTNNIWEIVQDSQNRIWVGSAGGLHLFDKSKGTFSHYTHNPDDANSLSDSRIMSLSLDNKDNLWIGTSTAGLNYFEPDTAKFTRYRHDENVATSLANDRVQSILVDNAGQLWVGTDGGLDRWLPGTDQFIHFSHDKQDEHSLVGNIVDSLMMSKDNILWIGTYGTGMAKYNPQQTQFAHHKRNLKVADSLPNDHVWTFAEDTSGALWLGSDGGGLSRFNAEQNSFTTYKHDPNDPGSISNNRVYAIAFDQQNRLWTSNYDGGVNRFDLQSKTFTRYRRDLKDEHSLSSDAGMSIFVDSKNRVWVGTYHGLNLYNAELDNFTRFYHQPDNPNSLSHSAILSVKEDTKGNLWIGTYGGGLTKLDDQQQFTRYHNDPNDPTSLSNDIVNSSLEDKFGNIWIVTYGGGLNKLDVKTGKFTRYGIKQGLNSVALSTILQDGSDNLWISSGKGLSMFNPTTEQFTNYTVLDGLQSGEFTMGAAFQSRQGEMFFGGSEGFNRFYPQNIKRPVFDMPLALTRLRVTNLAVAIGDKGQTGKPYLTKAINHTQTLSLSYLDELFSFEFSALGFARPKLTRYAYQLEGWNRNWIETGFNNRRATYTNIPAGDYVLKVKARGADADWGTSVAQLKITISPPPWKTWWAYVCYLLFAGTVIGSFMWQRHQKFRQISASEKRLSLALWSSGNELWDWQQQSNQIFRAGNIKAQKGEDHFEMFNKQALQSLVHKDDFEQLWQDIIRHKDNQSAFIDVTYRIKDPQDQWHWVRNRAKAVERDSNGQALRIIGTIDDIQVLKQAQSDLQALNQDLENRVNERTTELTEAFGSLKQTQQQLVESEKLAALGNLVVGVAHELNTPLGITITAATQLEHSLNTLCEQKKSQTLSLKAFDQFESFAKEGLLLLLNNLHRTGRLIHDFKALAMETNNETGKPLDLSALLNELKAIKQQQLEAYQIKLDVKCEKGITLVSHADAIKTVLDQLIHNSIVHAFDEVNDKRLTITVLQINDQIELEYADNGNGLSVEALGQIFEPFYTTKRGTDCTGLGMLIVHNLVVHKLAGTISCASEPGLGLRVTIALPLSLG